MRITTLRIATRKSPLALWQAHHVREALCRVHEGLQVELVKMTTQGDKILDTPLAKIGGKGLFVKELEQGLLDKQVDIAVHSMKDVPVEFPEGLMLAAILPREDPYDAFVSHNFRRLQELPHNAVLGTASLRRQSQLLAVRPDLEVRSLRGNVGTRLNKLDCGEYDAIILAAAGLKRLGLAQRICENISPEIILPAIGQGAIGIECRQEDRDTQALLAVINDAVTYQCVQAERAINRRLGGGCQVPIAGFAEIVNEKLIVRGLVADVRGQTILRSTVTGLLGQADSLGDNVAEDLLSQGAAALLQGIEL